MADKRRLPVLQNASPPIATDPETGKTLPPAWHWVPLGALVILGVGVILAKSFYVPFMQRQVARVYGSATTREAYDRIDAQLSDATRDALRWKLMLGAIPVAVLSVAIGGFVVGRFGARTNQRHGTLAGITAMVLLLLFAGHGARSMNEVVAYAMLVPFGGMVGYLGGLAGVFFRARAQREG